MQFPPGKLHVKVQVYASIDFKRSTHAADYETGDNMPNADFMFRLMPEYFQQTARLKPGAWVAVQGILRFPTPAEDRTLYFMIPPGDGVIYIKAPSLTP